MTSLHLRSLPFLPIILLLLSTSSLLAQGFRQTQTDDYTRYELLQPGSASFRILYDVSATAAGAPFYFNTIRAGAEEEVHGVRDLHTGASLEWRLVEGSEARTLGMQNANPQSRYIAVTLARPVPAGGQGRVRIDKTYRDTASYRSNGDRIVFERSLGINRNSVVLPAGYELITCNFPVQVAQEQDGRIRVSFMNAGPAAVPLRVEARRLNATSKFGVMRPPASSPATAPSTRTLPEGARIAYTFSERAFENRDISYFLQQPETHAFRLYHDYTETRPGTDRYLNVVRAGSKVSDPRAALLDTGEQLRVETLHGDEITQRGIEIGSTVSAETEVVVIWFDAVAEGTSARLRIEETYTDPDRYLLSGDELVWDRGFGRPRNTVVLPEGWALTASAVPAVISETEDGRIRLRYINDRPGEIQVFIKAKRR
jgi:hypothetical protein